MQENDDNLLITIVDGDENVCIYTLYKFTNGEEKSVYISIIYIYLCIHYRSSPGMYTTRM